MWDTEPLEISKLALAEFDSNSQFQPRANSFFEIKTCQRTLFLYANTTELNIVFGSLARRNFQGADAYEFLLRFACGLESEIKGETDVFGQLKTAFKNLSHQNPTFAAALKNIFLKIFEDTKEIRATYLQGIGGNTYGALARRLLNPTQHDTVLMIGAGELTKSVSPYFAEFSLSIWNRSAERLSNLGEELAKKGHAPQMFTSIQSLDTAIQAASLILIATPFGSDIDERVSFHRHKNSKVLHLGGQNHEVNQLNFPAFSLTDLFEIEKEQNSFRQKQVQQAMNACHERSLLRGLSRSIHVAHGWEDLAVFF